MWFLAVLFFGFVDYLIVQEERKEYQGFRKSKNLVSGTQSRDGCKVGHMLDGEVAMPNVSTLTTHTKFACERVQ